MKVIAKHVTYMLQVTTSINHLPLGSQNEDQFVLIDVLRCIVKRRHANCIYARNLLRQLYLYLYLSIGAYESSDFMAIYKYTLLTYLLLNVLDSPLTKHFHSDHCFRTHCTSRRSSDKSVLFDNLQTEQNLSINLTVMVINNTM